MNSRVLLLASLFGGIITLSTKAQTITAPTGQNLTITNPVDVTGAGNSVNVPSDGSYKIAGTTVFSTKGSNNVLLGAGAGVVNTTGDNNLFMGFNAGNSNTTASQNLFFGSYAGRFTTTGGYNTFIGTSAGAANTIGTGNMCIGYGAGNTNVSGISNTYIGVTAGNSATGSDNSFIGTSAGYNTTTGNRNVGIGTEAGVNNTTGNNNTYIGWKASGTATLVNSCAIGATASVTTDNTVVLGNAATTITGAGLGAGLSGLKFANLNSASATTAIGGSKVLSVDGSGNVVLVALTSGTINSVGGPVAEKTWKEEGGYLYNNSTNGVVINGTGLDGNSLIVKGGVLSKEVNVKVEGSESWPDYVFKPSYKRMTLDEVEKFININGHLPNVASATEMAATGNNLNKTDIKLLEKVEELTLYLLEMKKSNEAQNAEIQNLKKQVKSLRRK
jgi:trimeric autotransporter adhesin